MQAIKDQYDVAIIGGGLAGLSLSILLAREGYTVVLFEKEKYPYHKVCGEYISMESWPFLQHLGVPLKDMQLPLIDVLQLTAPNGKTFTAKLPLGGFGISRFILDNMLASTARESGVTLLEEARVDNVHRNENFGVHYTAGISSGIITAKACCGAFGKRSNLDVKWQRPFISSKNKGQNHYIGIKYHVHTNWPAHLIGLHNFKDGYCGISKVEEDRYCLCYLTTANNLKLSANSIPLLEEKILGQNPVLKKTLQSAVKLDDFPVTIAQISFSAKAPVENGVLMLGDAAGMITPLCGNGMSIALHTGKIAASMLQQFLSGKLTYAAMEAGYRQQWNANFKNRLATGRLLQSFFGSNALSNLFVQTFRSFPFLASPIIKKTHGQPF